MFRRKRLTLFCLIVGASGDAFPVDIKANKSVGHLKKEIKKKKPNDLKDVDADKLQLYLAKQGSNWLASNDPAVISMQNGDVPAQVEELLRDKIDPADKISDVFVPAPLNKQVHVLVVPPDNAVGSASEAITLARISQQLNELTEYVAPKKRKYNHSSVGSENGPELLARCNIEVITRRTRSLLRGTPAVTGYEWKCYTKDDGEDAFLPEESQRKEYCEYVESNIVDVLRAQQLCVEDVAKTGKILTATIPGRDIKLVGCADILILIDVIKKNALSAWSLPDVRMLIEVKRKVTRGSQFQALSELIALDLLTSNRVMALLTDLNSMWVFYWVSETTNNITQICEATIDNPGEAFEVIKNLLAQSPTDDTEFSLPCIERPVKRKKLSRVLTSIDEGRDGGGIRESIQRYYDIASMLGPDVELAREVAKEVVGSIPTFSYFS